MIIADLASVAFGLNCGDYQDLLDLLNTYISDDRPNCFDQ